MTWQVLVEGAAFFVPFAFFVVILVRGSRGRPPRDNDDDQAD